MAWTEYLSTSAVSVSRVYVSFPLLPPITRRPSTSSHDQHSTPYPNQSIFKPLSILQFNRFYYNTIYQKYPPRPGKAYNIDCTIQNAQMHWHLTPCGIPTPQNPGILIVLYAFMVACTIIDPPAAEVFQGSLPSVLNIGIPGVNIVTARVVQTSQKDESNRDQLAIEQSRLD